MFIIRNVFQCKPGEAKNLVKILKETFTSLEKEYDFKRRVMSDTVGPFWTVVLEIETPDLATYEDSMRKMAESNARRGMEGYMNLVVGGHREIWKVE